MEAIILAGGLGTRLRSVLPPDLPKSMAPVGERPFLTYLLDNLIEQNFSRVILSVFYSSHIIQNYFGNRYKSLTIDYAVEMEALGTGGGIKNAMTQVQNSNVFAFNGDSLLQANFSDMLVRHGDAELSVALFQLNDPGRYGSVEVNDGIINRFLEKVNATAPCYVNAGVYLLNKERFLQHTTEMNIFSFEKDFLEQKISEIKPKAYVTAQYFIDIGVPKDYQRFCDQVSVTP